MARELYLPVNGFSKKTSKFYAPVNGFSKEIVKAYCSVNGFSKLFYVKGGGGKAVPEYDYRAGQTYIIHNYFNPGKTMDLCFDEFKDRAISLQLDTLYPHCNYFIDNWETIKGLMLDAIEGLQIDVSNITCVIYCNKTDFSSSAYTYIALRLGDDVFPKSIGIQSINTDDFNEKYYRLATRPTPPSSDYHIYIYAYSDHYVVMPAQTDTTTMIQLGLWSQNNTNRFATTLTSFGMKSD